MDGSVTVTCPDCKDVRTVDRLRKNQSGRCSSCAQQFIKTWRPNKRYFRICIDCGDVEQVKASGAKAKRCRSCSDKARQTDGFVRTCIDCGDQRTVKNEVASKAKRCHACASVFKKTNAAPKYIRKKNTVAKTIIKKPKHASKKAIAKQREINREHKAKEKEFTPNDIPEQKMSDEDMIAAFYAKQEAS